MVDKEELYDQAVDLYADEKYDEAIALYQQALEDDPKYTDAIHGLTMCYQAKGDLDGAIELTLKYIEQEPEDILGWTNLSMFYQKKGMVPEAEKPAPRRGGWTGNASSRKAKSKMRRVAARRGAGRVRLS